ncbi:MAG: hypothetical protein VX640_08050 [Pseudomonadota bacterium]|nr:hypothetical protein [Pseudomonadota bacterium]
MRRFAVHALTGAAAAFAAYIYVGAVGLTPPPETAVPGAGLAGALQRVFAEAPQGFAAMAAVFIGGFIISLTLPQSDTPFRSIAMRALAALNPALVAAAVFPGAVFLAIASLLVWRGVFLLAAENDHRSTILLALALAAAPLFSHQVFFLYPPLLALLPLLSPWGFAPRRALGFLTVLTAPLALIAAGALFLVWLFAIPVSGWPAPIFSPVGEAKSFIVLLAAPGLLLAALGFAPDGRAWKAALIFAAAWAASIAFTAHSDAVVAAAVAAGHIAWAAQRRRALALLAAGFFTGGALTAVDFSPSFRAAVSDAAAQALARIAPAPANP